MQAGFTLIELLISMGIFTLLASLGLFVSMDFYRSYAFRSHSSLVVSALERARNHAQNNINGSPYGVHIASANVVIFQGASYASRSTEYDEPFPMDSSITVSGSPVDIVFTQLSGASTVSNSFTMTDDIHTATLFLNYEGRISW